jgi:hypothetical protein
MPDSNDVRNANKLSGVVDGDINLVAILMSVNNLTPTGLVLKCFFQNQKEFVTQHRCTHHPRTYVRPTSPLMVTSTVRTQTPHDHATLCLSALSSTLNLLLIDSISRLFLSQSLRKFFSSMQQNRFAFVLRQQAAGSICGGQRRFCGCSMRKGMQSASSSFANFENS